MTDSKKPDNTMPPDHPFMEIVGNRAKARTYAGMIEMAKGGDQYAAQQLLAQFINQVSLSEKEQERGVKPNVRHVEANDLTRYVSDCFAAILSGADPNQALNLTSGDGGRPKLTSKDKEQRMRIGLRVIELREEGLTVELAYAAAAEEFHVSESTARQAYRQYALGKSK